jgi:transposase
MKARYQYRIYPTDQQRQSLAQLFGCVRVAWNDALALCKQSERKPKSAELQKIVITQAKQSEAKNPSVGIDLGIKTFAAIGNGEKAESPSYKRLDRKVRKLQRKLARQPKESKRKNVTLIKIAKLHNRIGDTRKDFLHKLSTKSVQTVVLNGERLICLSAQYFV